MFNGLIALNCKKNIGRVGLVIPYDNSMKHSDITVAYAAPIKPALGIKYRFKTKFITNEANTRSIIKCFKLFNISSLLFSD